MGGEKFKRFEQIMSLSMGQISIEAWTLPDKKHSMN